MDTRQLVDNPDWVGLFEGRSVGSPVGPKVKKLEIYNIYKFFVCQNGVDFSECEDKSLEYYLVKSYQ